ncbi:endolytic transglycosylase MltG [Oceanibium sediminis]|uniref:endolytic transglycosylase MltG n=1 Tax=Oceanibium sediminis TaxID=2026339 RepID=UPI000DD4B9E8|nr:endolytic transglycosylase MltG [Oceanibium sediminis]
MSRHLAANGLTFLIVTLVLVAGLLEWGRSQFSAPGPLTESTVVEVPSGANLNEVAALLADAGAITSPLVFRIGARWGGEDESLKLGCYDVPPGASMAEVLDLVTNGSAAQACFQGTFVINNRGTRVRVVDAKTPGDTTPVELDEGVEAINAQLRESGAVSLRVSVAEGLTVREVLLGLQSIPFLDGDIETPPAEGMMAPDTYNFSNGGNRAALVAQMVTTQERRLAAAWEERNPDVPLESAEELLTLASIIEKETGVAAERGLVAAVFVNRLNRGMRLQTDPTIIYGVTRGQEAFDRPIRRSDIDGVAERNAHGAVEYNTYQITGLPPGPIANPGRASLMAAANPEESSYLFFVAKGDGTREHLFAETLAEHERNVADYRRLQSNN